MALTEKEWKPLVPQLRALWAEGMPVIEIAHRMGIPTKNAIIGKAHRLHLPARHSPIRRDTDAPAPPPRVTGPTLPTLASDMAPAPDVVAAPVPVAAPRPSGPPPTPYSPRAVLPVRIAVTRAAHDFARFFEPDAELPARPRIAPMPQIMSRSLGRVITCQWPIGEPGTRDFHFCDVPSEPARSYCVLHCTKAYPSYKPQECAA